jgi:hypothetical protein
MIVRRFPFGPQTSCLVSKNNLAAVVNQLSLANSEFSTANAREIFFLYSTSATAKKINLTASVCLLKWSRAWGMTNMRQYNKRSRRAFTESVHDCRHSDHLFSNVAPSRFAHPTVASSRSRFATLCRTVQPCDVMRNSLNAVLAMTRSVVRFGRKKTAAVGSVCVCDTRKEPGEFFELPRGTAF